LFIIYFLSYPFDFSAEDKMALHAPDYFAGSTIKGKIDKNGLKVETF